VTSSVHSRGRPPSARKGGLGGGVPRRGESRDLRVEQAHAFLRERKIQRERERERERERARERWRVVQCTCVSAL
jgi:hypothetical protein